MFWLAVLVGVPIVLVGVVALWFLVPTFRTFRGPDFEPTYDNDARVDKAVHSDTITGGGASM